MSGANFYCNTQLSFAHEKKLRLNVAGEISGVSINIRSYIHIRRCQTVYVVILQHRIMICVSMATAKVRVCVSDEEPPVSVLISVAALEQSVHRLYTVTFVSLKPRILRLALIF